MRSKITENNGFWPENILFKIQFVMPTFSRNVRTMGMCTPGGYLPTLKVETRDFQVWKIRAHGDRKTEYLLVKVASLDGVHSGCEHVATPMFRCIPGAAWKACVYEMTAMIEEIRRDESPNVGCLEDMRCPECGSFGDFKITTTATFLVNDKEGAELERPAEWSSLSRCECCACGFASTQGDFTVWRERGRQPRFPSSL